MEYIEIKDNIIIGHYCGAMPDREDGIERVIIDNPAANIGEDIRIYQDLEKGIKKPLKQLIEEGFESIPEGKKLNEEETDFIDMTDADKIKAGLIELKITQKIDGDFIVPKTQKELYVDGLITAEEYNEYIVKQREFLYRQEVDVLAPQVLRGEVALQVLKDKTAEIKKRYPKVGEDGVNKDHQDS